jgi:hypothetical protein
MCFVMLQSHLVLGTLIEVSPKLAIKDLTYIQ